MVKSMTGYGIAKGSSGKVLISIEIKSINSRYLDCSIKLPRAYTALEDSMKSIVGKNISRGKVEVYLAIDSSQTADVEIKVNKHLAEAYILSLRELAEEHGLSERINVIDIARFPDVLQAERVEVDAEQLKSDICSVLEAALCNLNEMRISEGAALCLDIKARLKEIEGLAAAAEEITPRTVGEYQMRLEARMRDLLQSADIDEQRILTEAAIFADRVTINEEIVRLKSHVAQLYELLDESEPIGRKIDFLLQEFNREANTIGSKGNDAEMSKTIVDLKAEIEKIREQAQNIE